jgi:hypothetical protein
MGTLMHLVALAALLAAPGGSRGAGPVRYLGVARDGSAVARVEVHGRVYRLRAGDAIPGLGRVQAVTDQALVVQRVLGEAEKQARAASGTLAPDVLELRVPLMAPELAAPDLAR